MITLCHKCHYGRHDFEGLLGGSRRKENIKRDKEIIRRYQQGGTTGQKIAQEYGVTHQRIFQILKSG